jgi:uroporphyrinogen decarboxylase
MKKLLAALQGQIQTPPPLWLMRQAGRYLPEYQAVRAKAGGFLDLVFNPELAAEVTLQPVHRFGMDAAILFSDILVVPHLLGQQVEFIEGEGPKLGELDVNKLACDIKKAEPVFETVRKVKAQMPEGCTLIGFAGSPFTVAAYMIEGGGSQDFERTRNIARGNPAAFEKLIDKIIGATLDYVEGQVAAGAEVIQLFDSHCQHANNFQRWVVEPTAAIVMILKAKYPKLPIIGFPRGAGAYLSGYAVHTGVDALGLDQGVDLKSASEHLPKKTVLQGNLDPALLVKGGEPMQTAVREILLQMKNRPFIFNLGHGVEKETPPEHVAELVKLVRGAT